MNSEIRMILVGCVLVSAALVPGQARCEDPQPTPSPEPTKVQAKRPKTLSDLAGGIQLQKPEGEKDGGVVIDNSNLKKMGEGAVVSQGKAVRRSPSVRGPSGRAETDEPQAESQEVARMREKVQALEQRKAALDEAAEGRKKTNMYTGAGPQYRPPGVEDPLDQQRKRIEHDLDVAKKNLKGAERKARRKRAQGQGSPRPEDSDD